MAIHFFTGFFYEAFKNFTHVVDDDFLVIRAGYFARNDSPSGHINWLKNFKVESLHGSSNRMHSKEIGPAQAGSMSKFATFFYPFDRVTSFF